MSPIKYFVQHYQLPAGRLIYALEATQQQAEAMDLRELASACDRALKQGRVTLKAERAYARRRRKDRAMAAAAKIDPELDRSVTLLRDVLKIGVKARAAADPMKARASEMLRHLFPKGVRPITSLPYIEELAAIDDVLAEAEQFQDVIDALALRSFLDRIAEHTAAYRSALEPIREALPDFPTIKAHRERAHELLSEVIARTLGRFPSASPEDRSAAHALLQPIVDQNEAMREAMRHRRPLADLDPETGLEVEEEESLDPE